jgi:hypothetical protein
VHIYRTHKDERVKQLALATLHKMESKWAMGFLRMDLKFSCKYNFSDSWSNEFINY